MENFSIQLSQADLQLVPIVIGVVQIIKQNDYLFNLLKEWLTLIGLGLGIFLISMAHGWVWNLETVIIGFTVGTLASGSYDLIKNLTPKLANKKDESTAENQCAELVEIPQETQIEVKKETFVTKASPKKKR